MVAETAGKRNGGQWWAGPVVANLRMFFIVSEIAILQQ